MEEISSTILPPIIVAVIVHEAVRGWADFIFRLLTTPKGTVPAIALIAASAAVFSYALGALLFVPRFWVAVLFLLTYWLAAKYRPNRIDKATIGALQPLLIAMVAVALLFAIGQFILPRSSWGTLFWIEEGAADLDRWLERFLPDSFWARGAILTAALAANLLVPKLKRATKRMRLGLSMLASLATFLAYFASFTLFGGAQTGTIGEAIHGEKADRLKDDALAVAELTIGLRLKQQPAADQASLESYLDTLLMGVTADIDARVDLPASLDRFLTVRTYNPRAAEFPAKAVEERTWIQGLIVERARQIRESLQRSRIVERVAIELDAWTKTILGRSLTVEERREIHATFMELVREATGRVAAKTAGPFIDLATWSGSSSAPLDAVVELYTDQAKDVAAQVVDAIAAARYRPSSPDAVRASTTIAAAAGRPAFAAKALPDNIASRPREAAEKDRSRFADRIQEIIRDAIRPDRVK